MSLIAACRSERIDSVLESVGGCPLRIELQTWELPEIRDYLQFGLRAHGCERDVFSDQAIIRLHELSDGIPGIVARLAELALLTGSASRVSRVGPEFIEAADHELMRSHSFA